jgi:hypothetical protein
VDGGVRREQADLAADVNAHAHTLAEHFAATGGEDVELYSYLCECGSPDCHERPGFRRRVRGAKAIGAPGARAGALAFGAAGGVSHLTH